MHMCVSFLPFTIPAIKHPSACGRDRDDYTYSCIRSQRKAHIDLSSMG